jgi:hypothetical protein
MKMRLPTFLLTNVLAVAVNAQVATERPVVLTGAAPEDRQLTGLNIATTTDAVLTAEVERTGSFRLATPAMGNTWTIDLDALDTAPPAGTHLVLIAPNPTAGDVDLMVNGHGPYALLARPNERVNVEDIPAGTALSVVMDGAAFQLMNGSIRPRRPCIEGTVMVNEAYCIEPEKHAATDLFTAMTTCGNVGMRLCDWGEFVTACQRATEIGMLQPTSSWEWTGDASNENNCARVVGVGSCLSAGNAFITGSIDRTFRCCYSR